MSGVEVSAIGLGGYELGDGDTITIERAREIVTASLGAGVNWLDTAEVYPESVQRRAAEGKRGAAETWDAVGPGGTCGALDAPRGGAKPHPVRDRALVTTAWRSR